MTYSLVLSLNKKQLFLLRNNTVIRNYPIAIGKKETPTPTGHYSIVNKVPEPGGVFGAFWLGLSNPHYGIHGTNNPSSIGKEISGGCIRMHNKDVKELANLISVGTSVRINR
jgi:lipoprotein-anchoring transpeptidase ErfK/SrfK